MITHQSMLGYDVGDTLELIFRSKTGVLARQTTVGHFYIDDRPGQEGVVWVCYKGLDSGQGSFAPERVGVKPFGIQGVIVVKKSPAAIREYRKAIYERIDALEAAA